MALVVGVEAVPEACGVPFEPPEADQVNVWPESESDVAKLEVLIPNDYGSTEDLYSKIPVYYQNQDEINNGDGSMHQLIYNDELIIYCHLITTFIIYLFYENNFDNYFNHSSIYWLTNVRLSVYYY